MAETSLISRAGRKIKRTLKGKPADPFRILLLTNRDSDNVGDQVIEESDISLIKAAMKNLGIDEDAYRIKSRAAAIIPMDYIETKDPACLERAHRLIKACDLVFFGGAPLFNYKYQMFYERTAKTIEIAAEHGKPVVFSAIGVESYGEDDPRCQRLKVTLNFDNVKRITTRDGFDHLQKYKTNPGLFIDKVSDPAVFSARVFRNHLKRTDAGDGRKKIGVFVIRGDAFKDNGIDFDRNEAAELWHSLVLGLDERGYDYEVLTSGFFMDEIYVDRLARKNCFPADKCVFNINDPETLMSHMSEYDGVISCRLHPSIIAYSAGIPSVSLVWNPKVPAFYESVGCSDRLIYTSGLTADTIFDALEKAMSEGVSHDTDCMMSVYRNIYFGLRDSFNIDDSGRTPYTYDELLRNLPAFKGTSEKEKKAKLQRKFRRIYRSYEELQDALAAPEE